MLSVYGLLYGNPIPYSTTFFSLPSCTKTLYAHFLSAVQSRFVRGFGQSPYKIQSCTANSFYQIYTYVNLFHECQWLFFQQIFLFRSEFHNSFFLQFYSIRVDAVGNGIYISIIMFYRYVRFKKITKKIGYSFKEFSVRTKIWLARCFSFFSYVHLFIYVRTQIGMRNNDFTCTGTVYGKFIKKWKKSMAVHRLCTRLALA